MWDGDSMGDPLLSHQQYYQLDHYFITDHSMQAHFLCGLNDVIIKSFIINDIYNLIKGRERVWISHLLLLWRAINLDNWYPFKNSPLY